MRRRSVIVLIVVTLLGGLHLLRAAEQPAAAPRAPAAPRLVALQQERVSIAKQALEILERQRSQGLAEDAEFGEWERRLFEAETDAAADKAGRVAAAERYAESTRKRAERAKKLYEVARIPMGDVLRAKYELAGAEGALEELKAK